MKLDKYIIPSIAFPIIALLLLTIYKAFFISIGTKVTLPIIGYDPRDLLSGHYIIYSVDYKIPDICLNQANEQCVCIEEKGNYILPTCSKQDRGTCKVFIKGTCTNTRFEAGIEKYYIPEDKAKDLDRIVRKGKSKIIVSIDHFGTARVIDLIPEED